jgi:CubicO group peptidase (beta-lactamase class C family)
VTVTLFPLTPVVSTVRRDPDAVRRLFERHAAAGLHHGAQLAVYREGDLVLDLATGTIAPGDGDENEDQDQDEGGENGHGNERGNPQTVTTGTSFFLWSGTKPYAGACVHRLVERGELDYEDRLVEHWPEYATPDSEKAETTVGHVLSHQAGVPAPDFDDRPDLWTDFDAAVAAMEDTAPVFRPGETAGYHAVSYGWLVGELVRRVSGRPIDEFAREHVFDPLGMDRTAIGVPSNRPDDVSRMAPFDTFDRCRDPGTGLDEVDRDALVAYANTEAVHRAVIPAMSASGPAREMARFYACFAEGGTLDGTRVFGADTVEAATAVRTEVESDLTLDVPRRYALGFERAGEPGGKFGAIPSGREFGHGGYGSVVGWADPGTDLAMAYVTNGVRDGFEQSVRAATMADAVKAVFG